MINFIVKNSNYYLNYNGNEVSMDNDTMKIMNEKKIDNLNNINKIRIKINIYLRVIILMIKIKIMKKFNILLNN